MSTRTMLEKFHEIRFKDNGFDIFVEGRWYSIVSLPNTSSSYALEKYVWEAWIDKEKDPERFETLEEAVIAVANDAGVAVETFSLREIWKGDAS